VRKSVGRAGGQEGGEKDKHAYMEDLGVQKRKKDGCTPSPEAFKSDPFTETKKKRKKMLKIKSFLSLGRERAGGEKGLVLQKRFDLPSKKKRGREHGKRHQCTRWRRWTRKKKERIIEEAEKRGASGCVYHEKGKRGRKGGIS